MTGSLRWVGATLVLLVLGAPATQAQFGYMYPGGYGGWGGWGYGGGFGGTVVGNNARGMGMFAMGVGQYNVNTAQAMSINLDTVARFNQALWAAQSARNLNYYASQVNARQNLNDTRDTILRRLRDNPTQGDIESGNALNAALDQINDPNAHATGLSEAQQPIPSSLIKDIPFNKASEAITASINDLIDPTNWPAVLTRPEFENDRAALADAAKQARVEDDDGDIRPETLQRLQKSVQALRDHVKDLYLENSRERHDALPHLKALAGLVQMLNYPESRDLLRNVDEAPTRSLADLINFMDAFNLRFGVANTPRERGVYTQLYPLLNKLRDRVAEQQRTAPAIAAATQAAEQPQGQTHGTSHVTDFFGPMPEENLQARPVPSVPSFKPTPGTPQPPTTGTPAPAPTP